MSAEHPARPNGRLAASALLILLCWSPAMALTAEVASREEGPALLVNGKRVPPLIVFVNLASGNPEAGLSTVRRAASSGVNIVSFVCHHFPWAKPAETPDYSRWDSQIESLLQANPNALLIPRIGMSNVPGWWAGENADELMLYDNGQRGMVSVASEKWRREAGEKLRLLVRHFEDKYGDHMLAYHPCGQNTGEWFYDRVWENLLPGFEPPMESAFRRWLAGRYGDDAALQKAWHNHKAALNDVALPSASGRRAGSGAFLNPVTQSALTDFLTFQQDVMVQPLEHFAHIVKQETEGRKLVVYFYGYTFELSALPAGPAVSGHLALDRLLQCPDVDVICSPISYFDREAGGSGPFMAPVDSVQLHGKLWLNEDDTRTYLSSPEDGFGRVESLTGTRWVHQRNFAHIASRSSAVWWMDLPGAGWLDSEETWSSLRALRLLDDRLINSMSACRPEIAVVVDESSLLHLTANSRLAKPLLYDLRRELYRIGAPIGLYLLSDVCAGRVTWPKLYILLNAFCLEDEQREALVRHVARPGTAAVWFYAPGYLKGAEADPRSCSSLIGMNLGCSTGAQPVRARLTKEGSRFLPGVREGLQFGDDAEIAPLFQVSDPAAAHLARYDSGAVAVAARTRNGWTSIFVGPPHAPAAFLRAVAKKAGVHIYVDSDDVVAAGNGLIAVHASSAGSKTLVLPRTMQVYNGLTGKRIGSFPSVALKMRQGETRLFLAR